MYRSGHVPRKFLSGNKKIWDKNSLPSGLWPHAHMIPSPIFKVIFLPPPPQKEKRRRAVAIFSNSFIHV
jgi:hypothetical protein